MKRLARAGEGYLRAKTAEVWASLIVTVLCAAVSLGLIGIVFQQLRGFVF